MAIYVLQKNGDFPFFSMIFIEKSGNRQNLLSCNWLIRKTITLLEEAFHRSDIGRFHFWENIPRAITMARAISFTVRSIKSYVFRSKVEISFCPFASTCCGKTIMQIL